MVENSVPEQNYRKIPRFTNKKVGFDIKFIKFINIRKSKFPHERSRGHWKVEIKRVGAISRPLPTLAVHRCK